MGPSAIRLAGLGHALENLGVTVNEVGTVNASGPEVIQEGGSRARYLSEIFEVCRRTNSRVTSALREGWFPLILGGDHALSVGSVSAVSSVHRENGHRVGLIWIDAHADMNTPATTPSGNIHGMAMAILLGHGPESLVSIGGDTPAVSGQHVSILGARELDPGERRLVGETGIRVFTMTEIDERGVGPCMDEALERASDGTAGFHLSMDLDGIDPMEAPGVGTPVPGGLTYREAHLLCEKAFRSQGLLGFEVVELNPVLDHGNQTARLAVELIASTLGKTIL
jgi:arginase